MGDLSGMRTFYRIGKDNVDSSHWIQVYPSPVNENKQRKIYSIDNSVLSDIKNKITRDTLILMGFDELSKKNYLWYKNNNVMSFSPISRWSFQISKHEHEHEYELFKYQAIAKCEQFRQETKSDLLKRLFNNTNDDIKIVFKAIMDYTFHTEYSFWLYNKYTKHFILFASSFNSTKDFVYENDETSTLQEILALGNSDPEPSARKSGVFNAVPLKNEVWKNRIVIKFSFVGDVTEKNDIFLGIFSLYSEYKNYNLCDETKNMIRGIVKLHLNKRISRYLSLYTYLIASFEENYIEGQFNSCLKQSVKKMKDILGYEAISIWIEPYDVNGFLECVAYSDKTGTCKIKVEPVSKGMPFFNNILKRNKEKMFSYDVKHDDSVDDTFFEQTKTEITNWCSSTIKSKTNGGIYKYVGVIRAINKIDYDDAAVEPFTNVHINLLRDTASLIGYLYRSDCALKHEKKEKEKNAEFLKTLRHEIKTPLSSITQVFSLIKRDLKNIGIDIDDHKKIRDSLEDVSVIGERLAIIVDCLSLEPNELVKEKLKHNLFKEIIAPVEVFAKHYAKKLKNIDIKIDYNSLFKDVFCDAASVSIAFHVLVDNAIKYSDPGTTIFIECEFSHETVSVIVRNYSKVFFIHPWESKKIFTKNERGEIAKDQRVDGSGIGLHLAREIMELNDGSLELTNLSSPIIFKLTLNRCY
jgi:two-component sensor histidine kinase